ncbi:17775_t:CDS:2 [Cetraspora pellucida]|uniref:17775_t:CDS:1 n=1 Tax=Cetraspora pellucida TaxID=1433469 RepID=A0ACA9L353_9GLOM|nr:17775_t:CDS:2 [Cetraspora pellucida]
MEELCHQLKKIEQKTYHPNRSPLKTPIKTRGPKLCQKRSLPTIRTYEIKEGISELDENEGKIIYLPCLIDTPQRIRFNYSWTEPVQKEGKQKGSEPGRIRKRKSKLVSNLSGGKEIKQVNGNGTYPDDVEDFKPNIVDLFLRNRVREEN